MKIRQYIIILVFISTCLGLSLISHMGHFDEFGDEHAIPLEGLNHDAVDESFFKNVIYYSIESSRPYLELKSTELSISNIDGIIVSFNPDGIVYRYDKETNKTLDPIYFKSKNSRALLKKKEIFLEKEVEVKTMNTNLYAEKISILSEGEAVYANENVKTLSTIENTNDEIIINSNSAIYHPKTQTIEYHDNVNGIIKRKRIYEENINLKADFLIFKGLVSLVEMKGNVALKKGGLDAWATRGEVFLENYNKKLKYYALYDDVKLQEKFLNEGKPLLRKAFSEKLEGIMSEKKIILTGLPKVFQGRDVIKGNKITIRESIETVEVDDANTNIVLEKDKG